MKKRALRIAKGQNFNTKDEEKGVGRSFPLGKKKKYLRQRKFYRQLHGPDIIDIA